MIKYEASGSRALADRERTPEDAQWKDRLHEFVSTADWHNRMVRNDIFGMDVFFGSTDPTVGKEANKQSRKEHNRDWGTLMTRFMASSYGLTPALNEGWRTVRPLGIGGEAMVTLWAKTMPDGSEEFMGVREIFPQYSLGTEIPLEVRIHRRLSSLSQNTESVLQLRNFRRYPAEKKQRMYLEWAPHGNLRVLIARYLRWRRYLPEPFLWYLFHKLAKALVVLQYGRMDPPESVCDWVEKPKANKTSAHLKYEDMSQMQMFEACKTRGIRTQVKATKGDLKRLLQIHEASLSQVDAVDANIDEAAKLRLELQTANWKEIVHRDISPNNIFLGEPETGKWSMYPLPKLADYGQAIETYDGDPENPAEYRSAGISLWMAPEQHRGDNKYGVPPAAPTERISAQTNVYQVGCIIALATGLEASFVEEAKVDRLSADVPYRTPLLSLIRRCLSTKPKYRPSPLGLYRITGDVLESCYTTIDGDFDRFRVYYRGNEINDMETGFHIHRDNPADAYLFDEQFPRADTMNDGRLRIRPPTVGEFYPYESDGRDFFKDNAEGFRERHGNREAPQRHPDRCGFRDFPPHLFNRMTLPKKWNPDFFDSSDDDGSEAVVRYNAKMKERNPDKYQAVGSEYQIILFYTTRKAGC
ncbi:hypothetical protein MMC17_009423 [Xylographa soralifera]|nr:hypothetical protein [Xylographa soralifera]